MSGIDDILVDAEDVDKPAQRRYHNARQKIEMRDEAYGIVGDGVALDHIGLQAAVNDAALANDELIIRSGRYSFATAGQLVLQPRTRIAFDDGVTLVRTGSSSLPLISATNGTGIRLRGGCAIEHEGTTGAVSGNNAAAYFQDCVDTEIEDIHVSGPFYVSITFHAGDGWIARRIHSRGVMNRGGVYPYFGTKGGRIKDVDIDGRNVGGSTATTTYGINVNAANTGGSTRYTEDLQISGGRVRYCTHQGCSFGDLAVNCGVDNLTVIGTSQFYGFLAQLANGSGANRLTFNNCRSYGNGIYGFYGTSCSYLKFIGCWALENGLDGFALLNVISSEVIGCTAQANAQSGVNLIGGCGRVRINENTISSNPFGLGISAGDSKIRYDNNMIFGNTTNISDSNVAGNFPGSNIIT